MGHPSRLGLTPYTGVWLMQHMESLKSEVEKLRAEAKHSSSGRMLDEVDKYRKANGALHATIARLEVGVCGPCCSLFFSSPTRRSPVKRCHLHGVPTEKE